MTRRVAVNFIMGLDCAVEADATAPLIGTPPPAASHPTPAPIFALDFLPVVKAGERFSLNAWVYLDGARPAEVMATAFVAIVDEASRTITVSGRTKRAEANTPAIQRALVVGIAAQALTPGAWTVKVSESCRADGVPAAIEADVPAAGASWGLTVL